MRATTFELVTKLWHRMSSRPNAGEKDYTCNFLTIIWQQKLCVMLIDFTTGSIDVHLYSQTLFYSY